MHESHRVLFSTRLVQMERKPVHVLPFGNNSSSTSCAATEANKCSRSFCPSTMINMTQTLVVFIVWQFAVVLCCCSVPVIAFCWARILVCVFVCFFYPVQANLAFFLALCLVIKNIPDLGKFFGNCLPKRCWFYIIHDRRFCCMLILGYTVPGVRMFISAKPALTPHRINHLLSLQQMLSLSLACFLVINNSHSQHYTHPAPGSTKQDSSFFKACK